MKLSTLKPNPENPRDISEEKFQKLVESIKRDNKFMKLRPLIVDNNNVVIAGNMRLRALQFLEFKEIPKEWVVVAGELTEDERRRFVVIDNMAGAGFREFMIALVHLT